MSDQDYNNFPTDSEVIGNNIIERTNSSPNIGEVKRNITVGKVHSLIIFEVSDGELEIIERGSPNSTYLNFSIFLISIFISFLIALLTCDFSKNDKLLYIFFIICIISGILGILFSIIWYRSKNDVDDVIKKIRSRITQ